LGVSRSGLYYQPIQGETGDVKLKNLIDEQYTETPFYGSRRMAVAMSKQTGEIVNRKRIQRLMREMGIEAIYPRPATSVPNADHKIFPYLLRGLKITRPNLKWTPSSRQLFTKNKTDPFLRKNLDVPTFLDRFP
jgi:putative transposase